MKIPRVENARAKYFEGLPMSSSVNSKMSLESKNKKDKLKPTSPQGYYNQDKQIKMTLSRRYLQIGFLSFLSKYCQSLNRNDKHTFQSMKT